MNELKPCPFCGGEAKLYKAKSWEIFVECTSCHTDSAIFYDVEKAIEAWNRRTDNEC